MQSLSGLLWIDPSVTKTGMGKKKELLKTNCFWKLVTSSKVKEVEMFCTFIYMNHYRYCFVGKKKNAVIFIRSYPEKDIINFSQIFVFLSTKEFCRNYHWVFTVEISMMSITVALAGTIWTVSFSTEKFIQYQVFAFCSSFGKSGS